MRITEKGSKMTSKSKVTDKEVEKTDQNQWDHGTTKSSNGRKEKNTYREVLDPGAKPAKFPTKIVVRRLPPTMTQKDFLEVVSPLPDNDYFVLSPPDSTLSPNGLSWATINFVNAEDVYSFKERFDGYVFVDKRGDEFSAIVEFSPCQKIPKVAKPRKDSKMGTIDKDPEYIKFLEALENPVKPSRTMQQCLEEIDAREKEQKNKPVLTPLLEHIREQRLEKRQKRDQRRENRRKREDERKKQREEERKKRKEKKELEISEHDKRHKDGDNLNKERARTSDDTTGRSKNDETRIRTEKPLKDRRERDRNSKTKLLDKKYFAGHAENGMKDYASKNKQEKASVADDLPYKASKRYSDRRKEEKQKYVEIEAAKAAPGEDAAIRKNPVKEVTKDLDSTEFNKERGDKSDREQRNKERKEKLKNKERPAMQIYRPGMGKFSSQTIKSKEGPLSEACDPKPTATCAQDEKKSDGDEQASRERRNNRQKLVGSNKGNYIGRGPRERASKAEIIADAVCEALNAKSKEGTAERSDYSKKRVTKPFSRSAGDQVSRHSRTSKTNSLEVESVETPAKPEKPEKSGKSYRDRRRERREGKAATPEDQASSSTQGEIGTPNTE